MRHAHKYHIRLAVDDTLIGVKMFCIICQLTDENAYEYEFINRDWDLRRLYGTVSE